MTATVFMYVMAGITFVIALAAGWLLVVQADEISRLKAELVEAERLPHHTEPELTARRAAVYAWADAEVRRLVRDARGGQQ